MKLGFRYATSKCHNIADLERLRFHGYRGEALASMREMCGVLEIESKARGCALTHRWVIKVFEFDTGTGRSRSLFESRGTFFFARK